MKLDSITQFYCRRKKDVELDTDAPVTKVINILKNIQEQSGSEEVVEALEDAIYVLASNQFYQPNLNFQDDTVDNEINGWLNNLMNYKQPRRNAVLDEGVILGNVNAIAGSLTKYNDLSFLEFNMMD